MTEHPHLSYEQLEALTEGRLTAKGILAAHVRECPICSNELRDLKAFVHSFRSVASVRKPSWLESLREHFERPLRFAGAMAAVVAVAAGLYVFQSESQRAARGGAGNHLAAAHATVNSSQRVFENCMRAESTRSSAKQGGAQEAGPRCPRPRAR